jgi:DDE superfamily endonuclease
MVSTPTVDRYLAGQGADPGSGRGQPPAMIRCCVTAEDQTVAAGHSVEVDPARWQAGLDELLGRVAGRFARVEPRRHTQGVVLGLLSDLPPKHCWTIAEHAGDASPDGVQHLLARAVWDADAARDDVRALLVEHLGDPDAVLVVDETGDRKKGSHTAGCSARTPAPPARSTTPRSPSTWPTQLTLGMG